MAFDYINDAFKKLDLLNEQMFDTSLKGINDLSDFMEEDNDDEVIRVIDPDAESEEELKDSYVGKVIINCNVCHSHIFKDKEDISIEENGLVNNEMQCPYCGENSGFTIVGEIVPYSGTAEADETEEVEETEEVVEDSDTPVLEDTPEESVQESLVEDFKEVSITTDDQHMEMTSDENGKVTITTEPVTEDISSEETIVPVTDETEAEILANNEIYTDSDTSFETPDEENTDEEGTDEEDVSIEEVDEGSLDELGESYLRKVYENVDSFKTTNISANSHMLIVEGVITFNSGAKKKTGFLFESKDMNSRGQLRFVGYNKHLTEDKHAFTLVGSLDNKKLFVESLKYNYTVNNNSIRGVVRRK